LPQNQDLLGAEARRDLFADASLIHLYQSDYARRFLAANGAAQYFPLSDYTDLQFVHRSLVTSDVVPIEARATPSAFFPTRAPSGQRGSWRMRRHCGTGSISCRSAT
jgi:hypothetical protein